MYKGGERDGLEGMKRTSRLADGGLSAMMCEQVASVVRVERRGSFPLFL